MTQSIPQAEPIAIIGSGCRFPGRTSSPSKLWQLLREPRDLQTEIPCNRFNPHAFYHPDHAHHGTSNVRHFYGLDEDYTRFDAQFFGIKPTEAQCVDPQHRLLLETVYESIESAGLRLEDLRGSETAVYVGSMNGDYADIIGCDGESFPTYGSTGAARSLLSNRISYFFDWHGPSMTIDTACSSSMVAVHEAVQTLRAGRSRVAVAAGANLCLTPNPYVAGSKVQIYSPTGRCRMWDAEADGYARGDGVAVVVLKTLRDALADGDHIDCLIREIGVNQDGRTHGITMPSASAQTSLIRDTYARAGLDLEKQADRCQYFEAHGTGTPAGDPLEAEAISNVFLSKDPENPLYVGSIKTIVGHTEGTAGLAGLLKTSLALQNATIPPNMLFNQLNPKVEPFYTNLEIATTAQPWPTLPLGVPRRASVNSFGFGGTNAHAILEAYEDITPCVGNGNQVAFTPFIFSASSEKSLKRTLAAYAVYLEETPSVNVRDLSWTLYSRKSRLPFMISIPGTTQGRLLSNIRSKLGESDPMQSVPREHKLSHSGTARLLGVFTGQGAQWAGMGRELWQSAKVREIIQSLDASLQQLPADDRPGWTLSSEFTRDALASRIGTAEIAQPMCTAVQVVLVQLLRAAEVKFDAVVGHSSGEIAAAYAAGFISAEDAIRVAYYRGLCSRMAQGPNGEEGAMMAVGMPFADAAELCETPQFRGRITVAAVNSSNSSTLSGDSEAIHQAKEILDKQEKFTRVLAVDKAYHSHHMRPSSDRYITLLRNSRITVHQPPESACAWYSSVRGRHITRAEAGDLADGYWNDNMVNPVLYNQAIETAVADLGPFSLAIEVGPHPALKGPTLQVIQDLTHPSLPYTHTLRRSSDDVEAMAGCVGFLWEMLPPSILNLSKYDTFLSGGPDPQLVKDLPCYPWDHDHVHWHESRLWKATRTKTREVHPLLGSYRADGVEEEFHWRNFLSPRELRWLLDHRIQGQMVLPAGAYIATAIEAAKAICAEDSIRLVEVLDLVMLQAIIFSDESSSVETLVSISNITHEQKHIALTDFSFFSAAGKESTMLTRNAYARVRITYAVPTPDALPVDRPAFGDMVEVPSERFYTSLEPLGYGYTGPFRALTGMKRKLGVTTGSILRHPTPDLGQLTLHPATLDAAIQTVLLAKSFPGDGELWCLLVPKVVRRVVVNPSYCDTYDLTAPVSFPVDSILIHTDGSDAQGDIDIYSPDGQNTIARIEGLQVVPLEAANPANDRLLFSSVIWRPSAPNLDVLSHDGKATVGNYEFAYVLERAAVFYLKQIHLSFPDNHRARHEGPYVNLLQFAAHITDLVASGGHRYAKQDWAHDTPTIISRESQRYSDTIDITIMRIIGDHIVDAIHGQAHMLESLSENNTLSKYYEQALGIGYSTELLARVVADISHRYPHMDILEVGAGTGSATKKIFNNDAIAFESYTFTDISTGFFENAQGLFASRKDRIHFRVLDIEQDVVLQGFPEQSFDVIIACHVLHATSKLVSSLQNVRRLLKPGGYLVMLEVTNLQQSRLGYIFGSLPGWWIGAGDGRELSPCVTSDEWDRLLRQTGFSGIDTVSSDEDALPFPSSVIVSQAVDQTVEFLRNPLLPQANLLNPAANIVVVGGVSKPVNGLRQEVLNHLQSRFASVSVVDRLDDLVSVHLAPGTVTLNLSDLDEPVFEDLTLTSFVALKLLYEHSNYVLWVTEDSRGCNPRHHQSLGFGRCMLFEIPHVHWQFLDLDCLGPSSPTTIASALLRFIGVNMSDSPERAQRLLWTTEPELAVLQGKEMIPRVKLNRVINTRYNASRRAILEEVDLRKQDVEVRANGSTYALVQDSVARSPVVASDQIRIRVDASSLQAVCLFPGNYLYMVAGSVVSTGEEVIGFTASNCSTAEIPEGWMMPVQGFPPKALLPYALAHTVACAILSSIDPGRVLIVVEPDKLVSPSLKLYASQRNIRVIFVTTRKDHKQSSWIYIHPEAHLRSMRRALPQEAVTVLDMEGPNGKGLRSHICTALHPFSSLVEFESFFSETAKSTEVHVAAQAIRTLPMHQLQDLATADPVKPRLIPLDQLPVGHSEVSFVDWSSTHKVAALVKPIDQYTRFRGDRTYWLVGLTGSLGLSLCQWMIQHGARNIVLTSRNPKVAPDFFEDIAMSGARVEIYAGDVTNRDSIRSVCERISQTLPQIGGVVQGAMVLRDVMIKDLNIDHMHQVLEPKVAGSIHLDELFSETQPPLDFFVFFSSAISVTGNIGQANYAAANMFMASLAANRKRRGLAGSVININAILGAGYVTRETSEALQRHVLTSGHMWMSEGDLHTAFGEAILAGTPGSDTDPEITCGLRLIRVTDDHRPVWSYNPRFQHLVLPEQKASEDSASSSKRVPLKQQLQEARTSEEILEVVTTAFLHKLQIVLGMGDVPDRSIIDKQADDLGIDSLNIVEIRSWFMMELKVEVPVLQILGGGPVQRIIQYALQKLPEEMVPNLETTGSLGGSAIIVD
ncbi:hypothetical protein BBP40_003019 [Aspergillus hancockii]|nr:hypothetical protein BBP40_003019 [Aspergillus hancockii]